MAIGGDCVEGSRPIAPVRTGEACSARGSDATGSGSPQTREATPRQSEAHRIASLRLGWC